jgi:hypothetical protein
MRLFARRSFPASSTSPSTHHATVVSRTHTGCYRDRCACVFCTLGLHVCANIYVCLPANKRPFDARALSCGCCVSPSMGVCAFVPNFQILQHIRDDSHGKATLSTYRNLLTCKFQILIWVFFYGMTVTQYGQDLSAIASSPWTFNTALGFHGWISTLVQVCHCSTLRNPRLRLVLRASIHTVFGEYRVKSGSLYPLGSLPLREWLLQ